MKLRNALATCATTLLFIGRALALPIPSDGSDGNFNPGSNIEVDLSQAIIGAWDTNNSANVGKGRYDATKWAVVFKYASVNIPAGVTVTFKNNAARAPVVWLVSGNVNIAGSINIRGKDGTTDTILRLAPTEPGPGGFRGNAVGPAGFGAGYGPGAGMATNGTSPNATYATSYGNPQITPLIGGSGGGVAPFSSGSGGSAAGAILIASASNITIAGSIDARGGIASSGGTGSGGAIRLIAEQVLGNGNLIAVDSGLNVLPGRIRVETGLLSTSLVLNPSTVAIPPPATPIIWPAANAPTTRIISVDGVLSPTDPSAPLLSSADVGIQKNGNVDVIIETTNFPTSGNVRLRVGPKYAVPSLVTATVQSGGTFSAALWKATLTFNPGFSALQAIATVP